MNFGKRYSKQSYLKALLLVALAANLSWEPAMKHLFSTDLASGEAIGGGGAPATAAAPNTDAAAPRPMPPGTVTASATGPQADPALRAQPVAAPAAPPAPPPPPTERSERKTYCDRAFELRFVEVLVGGRTFTQTHVTERLGGNSPIRFSLANLDGNLASNLDDVTSKQQLETAIKARLRTSMPTCADVGGTPAADAQAAGATAAADAEAERTRIRAGVAACVMNDRGDSLGEIERVRCLIRKIARITVRESVRDRDRDRSSPGNRNSATREVERLVRGDIRRVIKSLLVSRDETRAEEGETLLEEAIEAVRHSGDVNDLDPRKMDRLVTELESLKSGAEVSRRTARFSREARDLRDDFRERRNDLLRDPDLRENPVLRQLALNRLNQEFRVSTLPMIQEAQLEIQGPLAELQLARSRNFVTAQDFTDFTAPYRQLRTDIVGMFNPNASLDGSIRSGLPTADMLSAPSDLLSIRSGLGRGGRQFDLGAPRVPNLNLGNFGLGRSSFNLNNDRFGNDRFGGRGLGLDRGGFDRFGGGRFGNDRFLDLGPRGGRSLTPRY